MAGSSDHRRSRERDKSRERGRSRPRDRSTERLREFRSVSRERSQDRSRSKRRVRSRSRDVSRSVSRELLRGEENVEEIAKIVKNQQEVLLGLFQEHKEEVDGKLQSRGRRFASKQLEKQYELNSGYLELAKKSLTAVQNREESRAIKNLEELVQQLESHEEDLLIADASPHGWLAVSKLRSTKELPKGIRKRLAEVDRLLSSQKERSDGQPKKKFAGVRAEGAGPLFKRPERRLSPEEAMFAAAKQIRPGICAHCQKSLHFYRECPEFWKKVQAAREAKAANPESAQADG
jgi:hypothetical protein